MERFTKILLGVWRELCRHIEILESIDHVAHLLRQHLPLGAILVRSFSLRPAAIETIAASLGELEIPLEPHRQELIPVEVDSFVAFCCEGKVLHASAAELRKRLADAIPVGVDGDLLAGPLNSTTGPLGLVLMVARPGSTFSERDRAVVQMLLEAFAVAIENDRRIHEVTRLREAAEAYKTALLAKLGRRDINDYIVGAESGLKPVMERVEQVAPSDVPVLIFGETGSGKEVIARAIHTRSRRASGPFLRVNCGAIPSELIDSELFGHERGSFTGAVNLRKGWFERADGGTLFLDEIGELPPPAQVRLLRILQDGTYERVGGQHQLKVDVRIVAATHRDLHSMTLDGRFRQDLWYRIAVFPIHLPSLRERPEDIPALAAHFALRACRRFGFPPLAPTAEHLRLLVAYPWPGNVRELAAVMDRAAILGDGQRLDIAKALGVAPPPLATRTEPPNASTSPLPPRTENIEPLNTVMARHIEAALAATHGRVEGPRGAARLLGINPHTLRARMRKLQINWKRFRPVDFEI
jgi:hydrogenase-4 transcriptional activator